VKSKEGTRLVLQWRKPEETNGIIKKYVPHFSDTDEVTNAYTMHSSEEEEYLAYEVTDVETEYKIKVQAFNSLPGRASEEITVQQQPNIQVSEGEIRDVQKSQYTKCLKRLMWKSSWEASQAAHNTTKNRYCNVVA